MTTKKQLEAQQQIDADFKGSLTSPGGRRVFIRVLTQSGLWSSSYVESPTGTAYNEGRRSVALALLQEAQRVCPELYAQALREQLAEVTAPKEEPDAEE